MHAALSKPLVICLGEGLIEFNQVSPREPLYRQGFGGDTSNVAIACARQRVPAGYLTRIGDDAFGHLLLSLWQAEGIDTRGVIVDPHAPTGAYFVTHEPAGHSFSYLRHASAASRMQPSEFSGELPNGVHYVHASGISQAISLSARETVAAVLEKARREGAKVSYDPNVRLKLWSLPEAREAILPSIAASDLFLPGYDDLVALTGLRDAGDLLAWCFDLGARNVVLKMGRVGCLVAPSVDECVQIQAHEVAAVDATGAGDCFDGALLARLAAGDGLFEAAQYANAAAALSTMGFGAVAPIPTAAAVADFLADAERRDV